MQDLTHKISRLESVSKEYKPSENQGSHHLDKALRYNNGFVHLKNNLKPRFASIFILFLFVSTIFFAQDIDQRSILEIENVVKNDMQISGAPGATIAAVKNDKIIYQKAFGISNSKTKIPVNTSTLFLTASVTKIITTTALLIACEKSNIDVNTPVGQIMSNLSPKLSQITIHQILSQSSGILDHWPTRKKYKNDALEYFAHYGDKLVCQELESVFSYTNFGHVLAGLILATLNESSFQDAIDELIFNPLQMNSSTFDINIAKLNNYSSGHKNGRSVAHKLTYPLIQPSASMFSNINDLSRFAICFMNDGKIADQQIISKKVIQQMSENYTPIGVLRVYFGYPNSSYNYGMMSFKYKGIDFIGHPGESATQNILFAMAPKHNSAFILLSNSGYYPFINSFEKMVETFLPFQENSQSIPLINNFDKFIGKYYTPNINGTKDDIIEIELHRKDLYIRLSEEDAYPLKPIENNRFNYKNPNYKFPMEIAFYLDDKGDIKYLNHFWRTLIKK